MKDEYDRDYERDDVGEMTLDFLLALSAVGLVVALLMAAMLGIFHATGVCK